MKKTICILLLVAIIFTCCFALIGCKDKVADNTEYYDTITKKLKLTKSYEGKSFFRDGIGEATVDAFTDGDTTRFVSDDVTLIIRYYSIDTPESTGSVEKWGKAASMFVKNQLSKATKIVLESSTGERPVKDSYGSRYLGYIWYKTADYDDFKLLNLEIVENGFSENKGVNTSAFAYNSYFEEATNFAKSIQLRLFSKLDDPLYSTDPIEMTIKDFWDNTEKYCTQIGENEYAGAKIVMEAYLESLYISQSGTYTFKGVEYDPETGKRYEIPVYVGYSSSSATDMQIGHKYRIIGTVQNFHGNFQISGINYSSMYQDKMPDGSYIIQKDYYLTFSTSETYTTQFGSCLYSDATVKSAEVKDGVLTIVATAYKRKSKEFGDQSEFTFTVKVSDDYKNTLVEGSTFSTKGYQLEYKSGKILINDVKDLVVK